MIASNGAITVVSITYYPRLEPVKPVSLARSGCDPVDACIFGDDHIECQLGTQPETRLWRWHIQPTL